MEVTKLHISIAKTVNVGLRLNVCLTISLLFWGDLDSDMNVHKTAHLENFFMNGF